MVGLGGNDIYLCRQCWRLRRRERGRGTDNVYTSASYTLLGDAGGRAARGRRSSTQTAINLNGNAFANSFYGNAGANILNGGGGNDALSGFGGADLFLFTTAPGAGNFDTIADFVHGDDTIPLDDAIFTALGARRARCRTRSSSAPPRAMPTTASSTTAPPAISFTMPTATARAQRSSSQSLTRAPALTASDFPVI